MSAVALSQAMIVGGSVLALWLYVRLGERRPKSFGVIIGHFSAAVVVLVAVHAMLDVSTAGQSPRATVALFAFFLPAVTNAFLSALYLLEHLQRVTLMR